MEKLFTFAQLERPDEVESIYVWYIDFTGGYPAKYNAPTWEGTFDLPCDDDFFIPSIRDGGGYVEVHYTDGTKTKINPICPMCKSENLKGEPIKSRGWRFQHKCQDCNTII